MNENQKNEERQGFAHVYVEAFNSTLIQESGADLQEGIADTAKKVKDSVVDSAKGFARNVKTVTEIPGIVAKGAAAGVNRIVDAIHDIRQLAQAGQDKALELFKKWAKTPEGKKWAEENLDD